MFEKTINYCKGHKEEIKTGVILVLAPIALLGLAATKSLSDVASFLNRALEQTKD